MAATPKKKQKPVSPAKTAARSGAGKETAGLTKLGAPTSYRFDNPGPDLLEAFPNRYPDRDYVITFEHPEFTSLCPMTGQPDFATITVQYAPGTKCVESKSFKLYMCAFRNHGSFMESVTNKIADDLIAVLSPRRMTVIGQFNVRGGTDITVRVEHMDPALDKAAVQALRELW
ncbi:NADPH-dependent 7-cyano-7-deazaguanine reductase [uncultured delta proteobacterium]|uniref:NADPH-dependent 7-cyano-7-deazaguanine reductase n=1 Tax=uncultured delta proteobacterium TaxID=34034 RepID=A0A212JUA9_9DELT|nr:NADPH-dependent 7-cyano-7-deazaguanine reductase [uncultured delta proteobacterium]